MGPFTNGIAAGRYVGEQLLEETCAAIVDRRIRPIRKRISSKSKLRSRLREELREAQQFVQLRRETEALAAYQTRVSPGSASVQVPNPYKEGQMLTIKLDPSAPLKIQIKKRFQKAAKLERSVGKVTSRLENVEREIRLLEDIIESSPGDRSFSETIHHIDCALQDLGVPHQQGKAAPGKEKGKTYRRYDIDGNWFVLVGRSNSENDFITFQLAGPNDWWFHAQSVPGSHVVLKSSGAGENPPEAVLLAAAGIAAYYSKARHSSLVPVIYTRRKYVRKPRKAPPGKVTCEREKTLFAKPELPQSQTSSSEK
jgi:predicted ribosome quality control (RQC) complex YloA/Tae2 family protein